MVNLGQAKLENTNVFLIGILAGANMKKRAGVVFFSDRIQPL